MNQSLPANLLTCIIQSTGETDASSGGVQLARDNRTGCATNDRGGGRRGDRPHTLPIILSIPPSLPKTQPSDPRVRSARALGLQFRLNQHMLDRSGISVTHLRPTLFCEWLTYLSQAIQKQNILPLPFADARYAPIAAEDQGRAIAAILSNPAEHAGKTYPLYGPREISQYEIAEMLTQVLGRKITYVPMEIEPFGQLLKSLGFNDHFVQHISAVAQDCRDGVCSGTNDLIEKLSGQKPMGMMEYISKNKAMFR
jgi:NAD(P)H dehydrogenase (quinone)